VVQRSLQSWLEAQGSGAAEVGSLQVSNDTDIVRWVPAHRLSLGSATFNIGFCATCGRRRSTSDRVTILLQHGANLEEYVTVPVSILKSPSNGLQDGHASMDPRIGPETQNNPAAGRRLAVDVAGCILSSWATL
jgi:hypothetical protein